MRTTSPLYKRLREQTGSRYEVQIVRGSASYGMRDIRSCSVHQSLLSSDVGPAIGGTVSARCRLVLNESGDNWPRMADFEIRVRLVSADETEQSEWLSFGTFWTDTRSESKYGTLTIEAFDGFLRLQQYWTDLIPQEDMPASWPITAAAAARLLSEATGVSLDSRDALDNTVPFVGLDTTATARDVWADIAAAHARNAVITPEGYVHLIPLVNMDETGGSAVAGIAVAGLAIAGNDPAGSGSSSQDYIYLGLTPQKLDVTPELQAVTGVELKDDAGRIAAAGNSSGYVLKASCNYSNSAAALLCLNQARGYVYRPFTASGTDLDPAAELGDIAIIDGQPHQIMSIDWDLAAWITADLAAPAEYEIDHEYQFQDDAAVTLRKALAADAVLETALRSYIQQTAEGIMAGVAAQYASDADLQNAVDHLQAEIDGAIESFSGSAVPTLENYPASGWTDAETRAKHVGDLYMVNSSGGDYAGFYYRFEQINGAYQWTLLKDSEITKALADAEEANRKATAAQAASTTLQQMLADDYSPTAEIEERFYTKEEGEGQAAALQSELSLTDSRLTVAMSELREDTEGQFTAMSYYIRYQDGEVIVGRTDEPTSFRISPAQVSACYGNEVISYWNQDKQRTPKQLEIPVGGSLRIGDLLWQPRSSGNLSLMWVGATNNENNSGE